MAEFSTFKVRLAWNPLVPMAKPDAHIDQVVRSLTAEDARVFAETVHNIGTHFDGETVRRCIVATHVWEEQFSDGYVEWLLRWERKDETNGTSAVGNRVVAGEHDGAGAGGDPG